jgi:hypothetical protein
MPCVSPELGAAETFDEGGSGGIYRGVGRCRIIQLPTRGSIGAPTQLRSPAAPVAGGRPVAPGAMDVRSSQSQVGTRGASVIRRGSCGEQEHGPACASPS